MRWWAKAIAGKALSLAPGGSTLHEFLQRRVTRSLPLPEPDFRIRVAAACRHLRYYLTTSRGHDPRADVFFEFGAGWDLTIPLVFRAGDVGRQILVDLAPLARVDLVRDALERLRGFDVRGEADRFPGLPELASLPPTGPAGETSLTEWLRDLDIEYRAPGDARRTGLAAGSVHCVTSTATLEHIPADDISEIFGEMYRILRPGGVMSHQVDMSDHFSHSDPRITPWHFLRFRPATWRLVNSDLLYQNRLRASAYVELARSAGFEVCVASVGFPRDVDPAWTAAPPVHPMFRCWRDRADLLATTLDLVCRKRSS